MAYIKATYYEEKKTAVYEADDGSLLVRRGGSVSWRFNNPGNIVAAGKKNSNQPGRIGVGVVHNPDEYHFAIFATNEDGEKAKRKLLRGKYANYTIPKMGNDSNWLN